MATKMSYQGASNIRGQKLSDMLYGNLVSGDQSIGGSIRSAVSDKMRASAMGIKEKFDPLNIARMFGGRFGTALAGRAMGRSKEDISYFANRGKKGLGVKESPADDKNDPLYTKVAEGEQRKSKKGDSISDVMSRIYNLIKHDSEDAKTQLELEHDKRDKHESIREKWHKELLDAIHGLGGKSTTIVGEKKSSSILDLIRKVKDFFKPVLEFYNKIKEIFGEGLYKAFNILKDLLTNPFILELAGGAAIGVILAELIKMGVDAAMKSVQNSNQSLGGPEAKALTEQIQNSDNRNQLSEIPGESDPDYDEKQEKLTAAIKKKQTAIENYLKPKGFTKKSVDRYGKFIFQDKAGNEPPPVMLKEASDLYDAGKLTTSKVEAKSSLPAGVAPSTAGAGRGSSSAAASDPRSVGASTASPAPAAPSAVSTKAQAVIQENNDMKLDESTSPKVISIDNSKTVGGGGGGSAPPIALDGSVSLRTDDSTLQKIQKQNLRPV
jgi:hypothetical protein